MTYRLPTVRKGLNCYYHVPVPLILFNAFTIPKLHSWTDAFKYAPRPWQELQ